MKNKRLWAYVDGMRRPELERLTPAMWEHLFEIKEGIIDRSQSNPMTFRALARRKLISQWNPSGMLSDRHPTVYVWDLTDLGEQATRVQWI